MTKESWIIVIGGAYAYLFIGTALGLAWWRIKRRRIRPPVEFKFLRGPGETLRRKLARFEEGLFFRIAGAALIPPFLACVALRALVKFQPQTRAQLWLGIGFVVLVFAGALIPSLRWVLRGLARNRDDRLGYLGERFVGDCLEPLKRQGWYIYHDVPGEAGKSQSSHRNG
jgi:hypothetical protein